MFQDDLGPIQHRPNVSLLDQAQELKKKAELRKESAIERQLKEEEKILDAVAEKRALMGVAELAKGVQYTESIRTAWRPPSYICKWDEKKCEKLREKHRILVEG